MGNSQPAVKRLVCDGTAAAMAPQIIVVGVIIMLSVFALLCWCRCCVLALSAGVSKLKERQGAPAGMRLPRRIAIVNTWLDEYDRFLARGLTKAMVGRAPPFSQSTFLL